MKKLMIIFGLVLMVGIVSAQSRGRGYIYTVQYDTLNGADTVDCASFNITGTYQSLVIQALCTQIGGTSDGKLWVEGSVDGTSFEALTDETGLFKGYPNDTLDVADGEVGLWYIKDAPFRSYRLHGIGTVNDTTLITPKYVYK